MKVLNQELAETIKGWVELDTTYLQTCREQRIPEMN